MKGRTSNGWREVKLADVATNKGEYGSGASAVDYDPKKPRYVRITDIDDDGHLKNQDPKSPSEIEPRYFLKPDDFLFARSGSIGRTYVHTAVSGRYQYAGYLIRFKLNTSLIIPKYLYYLTRSPSYWNWIQKQQKSVTISNINAKQYADFSFILPPLSLQRKIASILEKVEAARALRKRANELTQSFLKAVYYEMFGDPSNNPLKLQTVRIGDICNVETGGTPDRRNPSYWGGGNIPWIKTAEVRDNTVFRAEEFITQKGLDSSNAAIFPKDSILVAMYGQGVTRGKVAKLGIEAATNQACAVILPSKRYNTDYLFHLLRFSYDRLRSLGRGGNQPNLNLSMVREFEITMPPIQSQERFASFAKEVEDVRTAQEASGARIDTLFDSLLQVWYGR